MSQQEVGAMEVLPPDECMRLLQGHAFVGRIGFVADGKPVVLPVNYLGDDDSVVFCTGEGSKLSALSDGAEVAFEVDDSRAIEHSGWSVMVQGTAREITDPDEIRALRRGPLRSWAQPASEHWVRISIREISGRRLHGR
jgi:nitroimidazol reductase NimA-like FMN-containing flavoprotein (pyridoxamine 5'-phosphate oxidase superfamily)